MLKATVNGFDVSMIHRAGFDTETCSEAVTKLLNRGGMNGIMSTTLLVFCAFCFAGIMSRAGCLDVVLQKILSVAKSTGALITATVAACITMALTTGNSYLAILIPGEMFRDAYKERGLAAKNLSRTLEDAGTVVVPLIPWSAAGAYMASTLGVETLDYLPWAILCYTGWIFAIIWGFTGFGIAKLDDEKEKGELNTMSRVLLIKNANLYDPDPKGIRDILIVDEKVFSVAGHIDPPELSVPVEVASAEWKNGNSWLCGPACSCDWRGAVRRGLIAGLRKYFFPM